MFNEFLILQALKRSGKAPSDLKGMNEADLEAFINQYADAHIYYSVNQDIDKIEGTYSLISYGLAINKARKSLDKEDWNVLDKLLYSDL